MKARRDPKRPEIELACYVVLCLAILGSLIAGGVIYGSNSQRSFAMGLIYWPAAGMSTSTQRVRVGVDRTVTGAEFLVAQVPWSPLRPSMDQESEWIASIARETQRQLVIAVEWLSPNRTQRLDADIRPWTFRTKATRDSFIESVQKTAIVCRPAYFILGVEVNYDLFIDREDFIAFVDVYRDARVRIQEVVPECKVSVTFQYELLTGRRPFVAGHRFVPRMFGDTLDVLGVSTYPSLWATDPAELPTNYYEELSEYGLPVAVFECGWPTPNSPPSRLDSVRQELYLERAMRDFDRLDVGIVVWGSALDTEIGPTDAIPFMNPHGPDWRQHLGLWMVDGSPKQAAARWLSWKSNRSINTRHTP